MMMRRDLDESDLTQLSRVNQEMERRLKEMGYNNLWQIAFADADGLADEGRVSIRVAERMIDEAKKLVGLAEDEDLAKKLVGLAEDEDLENMVNR
jgi:hypothetical protein